MAQDQEIVLLRTRTLTNSAAEFVETRAGQAIIAQVTDGDENGKTKPPEFVTELDKFVLKDEVHQEAEYYKQSTKEMKRFQDTLTSFCTTLKKRKLDSKLGIEIKEPKDYTMQDVLLIAAQINSEHEDSGTTGCMRIIRKCFNAAENHEGTLNNLLSFAPTDIYGSVLCGGFTLILAAIKDHEQLRKDIQTGLSEIPQKLDTVNRLTDVYIRTSRLKSRADSVFLSIFVVLERIIDRLSMNVGEKFLSKVKGHGGDIRRALEALDDSIAHFQAETVCCAQLRLGRIEENGVQVTVLLDGMATQMTELKESQRKIAENQQKYLEGRDQTIMEQIQAAVYSSAYRFLASNPAFNAIDGTVADEEKAKANRKAIGGPPTGAVIVSVDKNKELVDTWLKDIADYDPDSSKEIAECLDTVESLDLAEKDKIQWIMDSDELYEWLSGSQSCVLAMEAETAPDSLRNAMSFTTALLAMRLTNTANFPVLSFFCGLGTNASTNDDASGPMAMLQSFNGQFLKFFLEQRPTVDLSFLAGEKYFKKSGEKIKHALTLFSQLLGLLGEKDAIFILIDSFSRLSGCEADGDKIIDRIIDMTARNPNLIIKVLVTDPLPNCPLKAQADLSLYLPDHVDGGKHGINIELLEQGNDAVIQRFQAQQEKVESSSDEESGDDDW